MALILGYVISIVRLSDTNQILKESWNDLTGWQQISYLNIALILPHVLFTPEILKETATLSE